MLSYWLESDKKNNCYGDIAFNDCQSFKIFVFYSPKYNIALNMHLGYKERVLLYACGKPPIADNSGFFS